MFFPRNEVDMHRCWIGCSNISSYTKTTDLQDIQKLYGFHTDNKVSCHPIIKKLIPYRNLQMSKVCKTLTITLMTEWISHCSSRTWCFNVVFWRDVNDINTFSLVKNGYIQHQICVTNGVSPIIAATRDLIVNGNGSCTSIIIFEDLLKFEKMLDRNATFITAS